MGSPHATNTAVRMTLGYFKRYLLSEKEKIEPHSPSCATGTTGTPALCAISSKPLSSFMSCPVREIDPSGKIKTSSPDLSARATRRVVSRAFAVNLKASRKNQLLPNSPSNPTKRIGRGQAI